MSQILKKKEKPRRLIEAPLVVEESSSSSEEYIRGPLKIWPWPLLNVILAFIKRLRGMSRRTQRGQRRKRLTIYSLNRDPATGYITDIIEREVEIIE